MNYDSLINPYENGATRAAEMIAGLSREQLLATPIPGKWSLQQLIIHVADSDQVLADRMKRVIAEEKPTLLAFDENRWMSQLRYEDQSVEDAVKLLELTRRQMARVLRKLPDAVFQRQGVHSQAGPMTLAQIVEKATAHLEHHLKFAAEKRAKLGK